MSDKRNETSPAVNFTSPVLPEETAGVSNRQVKLCPDTPLEDLDALQPCHIDNHPGSMSDRGHQRITQVKPALPSINLSLPNIRDPQMMNVNMYMPSARPPTFLKEVSALPGHIGRHVNREVQQFGFDLNKFIELSDDFLHKPPPLPEFTDWSIVRTLFSIAATFFDHGTDIATAYVLYDDSTWWFRLTVTLIIVPNIFINAFSLYWYFRKDYKTARTIFSSSPAFSKCWWVTRIVVHILLLGPIFRYIDLLYYGIQSRKSRRNRVSVRELNQEDKLKNQVNYYNLLLHEERDISILELMHSFLQDAPQLALQIYILAKRPSATKSERDYIITVFVQCFSSLTSLVSLGWSLTSYHRTVRYSMPHKPQISVGGSASLFLWHVFQVASRVLALSLFANEYKMEVFIVLGVHYAVMTAWILAQRTNFCGGKEGERKPCEEFFYNIVMGWVFTFAIINVKAAATRIKYTVFYILLAIENATLITLWFIEDQTQYNWYHYPALIFTFVSYVLGLFFMYLYYRHFHPDGRMPNKNETPKLF